MIPLYLSNGRTAGLELVLLHGNGVSYRAEKRVDIANNLALNF